MTHKLTLEAFIERYQGAPFADEERASLIVRNLPEDLPVVKAAHAFLEASRMFGVALARAGLERG